MKDYSNYYPSTNDTILSNMRYIFQKQLDGTDSKTVDIDNFTTKYVDLKVLIQDHTNPLNEYKEDRKIMCEDSVSIHRGSIVTEGTDNYLVITDIDTNGVYKTAKMQKTTHTLKWKDSTNTSHSVPAIITNKTLYDDGLDEGKQMTLENNKRNVVIPNNDETSVLFEQQRFIISDKVYEISSIDRDTQVGLLNIIMVQTLEMVGKDDFVNKIAFNEQSIVTTDIYKINITNEYVITLGYYTNWQIEYEVLKNGEKVNEPVIFTSSNISAVTVNSSTGLCQSKAINASSNITVKLSNNQSIYNTMGITVSNALHSYTVDIDGNDTVTLGSVNNYSALVSDKGIALSDYGIDWSIDYLGNSTLIAKLQNITDKTVIIAINNGNLTGKINLTAKYRTNNAIYTIKQIDISAGGYW